MARGASLLDELRRGVAAVGAHGRLLALEERLARGASSDEVRAEYARAAATVAAARTSAARRLVDVARALRVLAGRPTLRPAYGDERAPLHATTDADGDGPLTQRAIAQVTVLQPIDRTRWLVDPILFPAVIRQVVAVTLLDPAHPPLPGVDWSGDVNEAVDLLYPLRVGTGALRCPLHLDVRYGASDARCDYRLLSPTAELLRNEGSIRVRDLPASRPDLGGASLVTIEKLVQFRTRDLWERTFDLHPDGLRALLAYWILHAERECPEVPDGR